ncbi:MAG: hypothetical protein JWQ35_1495 [Bacteriovoracaceae bacterium]|nr:hypothetical protein [Bacteriovoracaceae bacterium]
MNAPQFPWQALKVICDGVSIIDTPQLELNSEAEAHQFLMSYGYDLYEPSHVEQIWKIYDEAVEFLENPLQISIPPILKNREAVGDFKNLLLVASGNQNFPQSKNQLIVCALLRVMHVLSHLKNDLRLKYIAKIRKQTLGRFEAHIQRKTETVSEQISLGFEKDQIPLVKFDKKEGKNKLSVILKLLQKPASVAQEINDHLGVRFVTKTRVETILVAKYLLDHHLISVANVMSARCRNTLFSLDQFRAAIDAHSGVFASEFFNEVEKKLEFPTGSFGSDNPFSSSDYHALQFTSRPLIRIPVIRRGSIKAEMSFFFPVEIQILDEKSYIQSQEGAAKHSAYKQKQLEAVRERVLRNGVLGDMKGHL